MNTFYHGDCLFVLNQDVPAESVELIYLDPPFFTGKIQTGQWRPEAMEVSFEDSKRFWKEKGISIYAPEWMKHIAVKRPDFASYLYYIMERLQACHKVLKRTGSIYLHCDYRALHYLKMVMDEIFSPERFINEIVWYYKTGGMSKRWLGRKHDTILPQKEKSYLMHKYGFSNIQIHQDENGYYTWVGMRDVWDIPALRGNQPETTGYPTPKPIKKVIVVSQTGFDDGARQREFEIETAEGIEVILSTPEDMLRLETP